MIEDEAYILQQSTMRGLYPLQYLRGGVLICWFVGSHSHSVTLIPTWVTFYLQNIEYDDAKILYANFWS